MDASSIQLRYRRVRITKNRPYPRDRKKERASERGDRTDEKGWENRKAKARAGGSNLQSQFPQGEGRAGAPTTRKPVSLDDKRLAAPAAG